MNAVAAAVSDANSGAGKGEHPANARRAPASARGDDAAPARASRRREHPGDRSRLHRAYARHAGAHFTCFTGTKVHVLTQQTRRPAFQVYSVYWLY
jgi:hypothetical protein